MYIHKEYSCSDELISNLLERYCLDDFSIICKYDDCRIILKCLMKQDNLMPFLIDIEDPLFNGYDKEFIISVSDNNIFCEKFYRDDYIHIGDDAIFVLSDCSKQCVEHIKNELDNCQYCEDVELLSDLSDCSDNESDLSIDLNFEISVEEARKFAELVEKLFMPIANILDEPLF